MASKKLPIRGARVALSAGAEPPKEFRIFRAGWNRTYKGDFLFDEEAAALVMAEYEEHGVDRPIDLEHFSIPGEDEKVQDPDARGWFNLEVRGGELWAVNVKWNPDGERRLRDRTQRYISPFFGFDKETRRVQSLYNVAICAIPATKDIPALVAASARTKTELAALSIEANDMNEFKKVCSALGLADGASLEDALGAISAFQEEDGKGKEQMGKLRKMLKLADDSSYEDMESALKKLAIGGGDADDGDGDDDTKPPKKTEASNDLNEDEQKELAKMSPKMRGKYLALTSNVDRLSKRLDAIEEKTEQSEVAKLVADNTDKIPLHLEPFWLKQDAETLREYLKHAVSAPRATPPKMPKGGSGDGEVKLTKEEKELAKLSGIAEDVQLGFKKERLKKEAAQRGSQAD